MRGFHCEVLACDPSPNEEIPRLHGTYVDLDELFSQSRIVSLHCPLTPDSHHLLDAARSPSCPRAFFTVEALEGIATTTLANATAFESGEGQVHTVA